MRRGALLEIRIGAGFRLEGIIVEKRLAVEDGGGVDGVRQWWDATAASSSRLTPVMATVPHD
jgi:hypothetical protein